MAVRIHAQVTADPAATDILLFVCPFEGFVTSRIFVCNRSGGGVTFRLAVTPHNLDATAPGASEYLYFDKAVAANDTLVVPPGLTLERGDQVWVRGSSTSVSFTLFGDGVGEEG